jgi:uncharacterized membrane protein YeaQ/YmgE (transglycosylase-associated protein family)
MKEWVHSKMLSFIIALVIIGIIAGYVARLLVPGPDPMSFVQTAILGIVGSFVGGFLGYVIFGEDVSEGGIQPSGIIGSVIGAVVALIIYNAVGRRPRRI